MALSIAFVCIAITSCAPTETQAVRESVRNGASEGQIDEAKAQLSKEQITAIADAVARKGGWRPELRTYDEGNARWKRLYGEMRAPELDGRDYQVVMYRDARAFLDGGLVVVVDTNTGAVLKTIP